MRWSVGQPLDPSPPGRGQLQSPAQPAIEAGEGETVKVFLERNIAQNERRTYRRLMSTRTSIPHQPQSLLRGDRGCPLPEGEGVTRILFFAEAVTLAHVARPVTLAQSLDPASYDVHLAWDNRYANLFPNLALTEHPISSIPTAQFTKALARGTPIYSTAELRRYVEEDRRVIQQVKPDLIVGDFRLSLAISAAVEKIPYAALANSYWSPHAPAVYPMPDHPVNRVLGRRIGGWFFNLLRPMAFARYAAPINKLRADHGLPSLGKDLRRVYTFADHTLYCDVPALSRVENLPANHRFIGPVLWSPKSKLPAWWDALPGEHPVVYVNLGS